MAGVRAFLLAGTIVMLALPGAAGAATIKVTTDADELDAVPDATCSLREAVKAANTNVPAGGCTAGQGGHADTIKLGTPDYFLTIPTTNEDANANGDLDVAAGGGPLVVTGKGRGSTFVHTDLPDRIFDLNGSDSDVTFR